MKKKYKIREKSIAWYVIKAKEPLQLIAMIGLIMLLFTVISAISTKPVVSADAENLPKEKAVSQWVSLGEFELTAYCPCEKCCGVWAENRPVDENGHEVVYTSSGAEAEAGVTIAVDPTVIPHDSTVLIDGQLYIAQDTGSAIQGNKIDVYFATHEEAMAYGIRHEEVFVKGEGN